MRRPVTTIAFALIATCSLFATGARGDPASDADALIQRGVQARKERRDDDALEDFLRAYQTQPSPRAIAQIALAELALGRWIPAEEHMVHALQFADDSWLERHRPTLEAALESARDQIASLDVSCDVTNAELWIGATRVGVLPLPPQSVAAGVTTIEVRADGFQTARQSVTLEGRRSARVPIHLVAVQPPLAPATTFEPTGTPRGRAVAAPQTSQGSSTRRTLGWTMLAAGSALLTTAVVAHVLRETSLATYNDDSRCLYGSLSREQRCGSDLGEAQAAGLLAVVAYSGAALAAGASTYFFVTASDGGPGHPRPVGLGLAYHADF